MVTIMAINIKSITVEEFKKIEKLIPAIKISHKLQAQNHLARLNNTKPHSTDND